MLAEFPNPASSSRLATSRNSGIPQTNTAPIVTETPPPVGGETAVDLFSRSEKMNVLGEMASGVIHDFNNLLGAILGRIQLVRTKTDPVEIQKHIAQIEKIVLQGAETVKRLQTFIQRRHHSAFEAVDMRQAIADALELTRHRWEAQAQEKGIIYVIQKDMCDQCVVEGIHSELVDVVANLIFNSLDAMPEGGPLTCRLTSIDGRCQLEISDEGVGMTPQQVEQVFHPFYTTKGTQGTGLGLAVVHGVITRHGGDIRVCSELGKGSTFIVSMPASKRIIKKVEPDSVVEQKDNWRVLLIDDDHTILDVLGEALTEVGYAVTSHDNGAAAIVAMKDSYYDVVVTDLGMPGVTGWEVARHAQRMTPRLPVIVISGWGAQVDESKVAESEIDALLAKPFHLNQLRETIARVVREHAREPLADAR